MTRRSKAPSSRAYLHCTKQLHTTASQTNRNSLLPVYYWHRVIYSTMSTKFLSNIIISPLSIVRDGTGRGQPVNTRLLLLGFFCCQFCVLEKIQKNKDWNASLLMFSGILVRITLANHAGPCPVKVMVLGQKKMKKGHRAESLKYIMP